MEVIVLGRKEIEKVLEMSVVIKGVEEVYRRKAEGKTVVWPLVSYDFEEKNAVMDIRSGCIFGENLHGLKMLNNFPLNTEKGLPPFNGMLMIFDSETGIPLGVMDASYITCMRTGAAGAIGAKTLARENSETLFILGAGKQAAYQIEATLLLMPQIKKVWIADVLRPENAVHLAKECEKNPKFETCSFAGTSDLEQSVKESDIIITVTPARSPVIKKEWVQPGTHFSCIGADMEGKEEIDPRLFAGARIYADDKAQCMKVGEMEIPLKEGYISPQDICGEIGQVLSGQIKGRATQEEITIFDATGLALLDLMTGKGAIERAKEKGLGIRADI